MTFEGFVQPTKNYFPVPNNWIDICATIRDISELKVIQYVIRHTWGFHEYGICKTISVDEFMHGRRRQDQTRMDFGTGLSEQSVRNGLKKAIKDGYLICEVDPSDAGRIKKSYALRMQANSGQVQTLDPLQTLDPSTGTNFIPQGTNPYTSDSQSLDPRVPEFIPRSEKDTIERHLGNTPKKESIATSLQEDRNAPAQLAFQVQDFPLHFYHDFCIHAQDRGINDGLTLIVRNLADVPRDAECDICYKPVHGPDGYYEIGNAPAEITDLHEWKKATDGRLKAVKGQTDANIPHGISDRSGTGNTHTTHHQATSQIDSSHSQRLSESDEPTVKLAAVKIGADNGRNTNTPDSTSHHATDMVHSDIQSVARNTNRTESAQLQEIASQHKAVKIGANHEPTTLTHPAPGGGAHSGGMPLSGMDQPPAQEIAHKPGAGSPLSLAVTPPGDGQDDATGAQASRPSGTTPARRSGVFPPGNPARPGVVQGPKCDTREIQRRINEHRGYGLEERGQIIQERIAVKTWCNLHEIGDFDTVMARLKNDPYWGKSENYYRIGGVVLLKETPKALANDKRSREPVPAKDEDYSDFDIYKGNGKEERAARLKLYDEMVANGQIDIVISGEAV